MTDIYLHFIFAHYGLYGNAPVLVPTVRSAFRCRPKADGANKACFEASEVAAATGALAAAGVTGVVGTLVFILAVVVVAGASSETVVMLQISSIKAALGSSVSTASITKCAAAPAATACFCNAPSLSVDSPCSRGEASTRMLPGVTVDGSTDISNCEAVLPVLVIDCVVDKRRMGGGVGGTQNK